jgi:hypothetical protein
MVGLNFSLGSRLMSLFGCLVIPDTANVLESNLTWYTLKNLFHRKGYQYQSWFSVFLLKGMNLISLSHSLLHALFT